MNKSAHLDYTRCKHGFTMVELLVVISIIAILSTIGLIVYGGIQSKSRDTYRLSSLRDLNIALEAYNSINGKYPNDPNWVCCSSWTSSYITGLVPVHIKDLPHDPLEPSSPGGPDFCYLRLANNTYNIEFRLENRDDQNQTIKYVGTVNEAGRTMYRYDYEGGR
ncbi:MAG: type II secretion system protein [Candidatus Daviesbacteria bacterium]|nr:type II secretion system protein [Candidatus Daviesbacteria bacterium]